MNINSGLTTAAITGSINITNSFTMPGATQTQVSKTSSKNGQSLTAGTGALLYTVTGGKTFYMTQLSTGHRQDANARGCEFRDGTTIAGTLKASQMAPGNVGSSTQTFPAPIPFTAGVFIDVDTAATQLVWSFSGFEQ